MRIAGMVLDFKNDSGWILGKYIKLQNMTSEHNSLLLTNMLLEVERPVNVGLHDEALKMFESGEKKEEWEIT